MVLQAFSKGETQLPIPSSFFRKFRSERRLPRFGRPFPVRVPKWFCSLAAFPPTIAPGKS